MSHSDEQSVAYSQRKEFDLLAPSRLLTIRPLAKSEIGSAAEFAKRHLPSLRLENLNFITAILAHDRDSIQRFDRRGEMVGLYALLFLNDRGLEALFGGQFDGTSPRIEDLVPADDKPAAIYSWFVACPGRAAAAIGNVAALLRNERFGEADLFARPATSEGLRIMRGTGHVPVTSDPNGLHRYTRIINRHSISDKAA
jgi:hypothetical protein